MGSSGPDVEPWLERLRLAGQVLSQFGLRCARRAKKSTKKATRQIKSGIENDALSTWS